MQRGNGAVIGKQNTPTTSVATGVWALNEVQRAVLNGTWPSATIVDPYFENVSLLLHGNGTNGAQNNTFLDSSTNNFTITRNGNTTQGTFTPYGANWSNYFDGSGDYLTATDNAAFQLGAGAFTIEAFFYSTSSGDQVILSKWGSPDSNAAWEIIYFSGTLYCQVASGSTVTTLTTTTFPLNQWNHVVMVRSGNTLSAYLNGTRFATNGAYSSTINAGANGPSIGTRAGGSSFPMVGYISNARIVKGTAVYDPTQSTLTVPTAPLTAITNTSLLTCQSNRFIDNSSNAFTITRNGDVSVQRFSPFNPTAAYSAATIGGSGYFDGNGDYLSAADNAAFNLNGVSFTVECWVYWNSVSGEQNIVEQFTGPSGPGWTLYKFAPGSGSPAGSIDFYGGGGSINSGVSPVAGQWYHLAVSRNNSTGTTSFYVNGTRTATATFGVGSSAATALLVGVRSGGTTWFNGYMGDLRVVKGSYVYDPTATTITVPTAPLTAVTNTSLLLSCTNGGIIDNAMMNDLETVGNAQISTSVSKFGGGSIAFDGTGDYLTTYGTPQFAFGSGDFTIECWVYFNSLTQYDCIIDFRPSGTNGAYPSIFVDTSNTLVYYVSSANRITSSAVSTGQWYHLAVSRTGTSTKMFLNGVQTGSTYTDSSSYLVGNPLTIGGLGYNSPGTYALDGYIDDLRITKGYARYTADFTPPTLPFPDQ